MMKLKQNNKKYLVISFLMALFLYNYKFSQNFKHTHKNGTHKNGTSTLKNVEVKAKLYNKNRIACINKINAEIKNGFKALFGKANLVHVMSIQLHRNYGDTFIWVGEYLLIKQLGIKLGYICGKNCKFNPNISPSEVIGFQGGGNFGDLYRGVTNRRNELISKYPKNKFVFFPLSVYYNNKNLTLVDRVLLENHNVHVTLRQQESLDFFREYFPNVKSYGIPDIAFMIGNVETNKYKPKYDVIILRRLQIEAKKVKSYTDSDWNESLDILKKANKTYLFTSWKDHPYKKETDPVKRGFDVLDLSVELLSRGKIVITDALHASILSVLMNKPHVYFDNGYNKVIGTRNFAFKDKEECDYRYLRAKRAKTQDDAVLKAIEMLNNKLFAD